jgi:hypothetical protein
MRQGGGNVKTDYEREKPGRGTHRRQAVLRVDKSHSVNMGAMRGQNSRAQRRHTGQRGCGNQCFEAKVGQARQAYKRLDMAVTLGLNVVDKEFDRTEGVQDLDKEDEILVKAFLTEEGGNRGGKMHKKKEHDTKPYDRDNGEEARMQLRLGAGMEGSEKGQDRTHDELGHGTAAVPVSHDNGWSKFWRRHAVDGGMVLHGYDADGGHADSEWRIHARGRAREWDGQKEAPVQQLWGHGSLEILASVPEFPHAPGTAGHQTSGYQTAAGSAGSRPEWDSHQTSGGQNGASRE